MSLAELTANHPTCLQRINGAPVCGQPTVALLPMRCLGVCGKQSVEAYCGWHQAYSMRFWRCSTWTCVHCQGSLQVGEFVGIPRLKGHYMTLIGSKGAPLIPATCRACKRRFQPTSRKFQHYCPACRKRDRRKPQDANA